jgi:phenylpyruvate tautomerase PptA (4-oxalocrotonate tautomerase family)
MHATQGQQEAAAATITQTVQHLLARAAHVDAVVLQQVILEEVAVGAKRLDQLQQQCFEQLCSGQL